MGRSSYDGVTSCLSWMEKSKRAAGGLVVLVAAAPVAGCSGSSSHVPAPTPVAPTSLAPSPDGVPFELLTHCGIGEVLFDGMFSERVGGLLDDGLGNPSLGWDNPTRRGVLRVEGDVAFFTDEEGHSEVFELRPGATAPARMCG